MLIWIVLFLLVSMVAFVLALKSMEDFTENSHHLSTAYSVFLVRKAEAITPELLDKLFKLLSVQSLIISFEKLANGARQALVIYGPVVILERFRNDLDLLELEEYSMKDKAFVGLAWQLSLDEGNTKDLGKVDNNNIYLKNGEEIWLQVVLKPKKDLFLSTIRVIITGSEQDRLLQLRPTVESILQLMGLRSLPEIHDTKETIKSYQSRSLPARSVGFGESFTMTLPQALKVITT